MKFISRYPLLCTVIALTGCAAQSPETGTDSTRAQVVFGETDVDGDGLSGVYDCNDDDATLPAACPQATGLPGRAVWCDDGLPVPESRSIMNWVNHDIVTVDGRDKGVREYLYTRDGRDAVPAGCDVAVMATRGGPTESNTEQLARALVERLDGNSVAYVLGGRSRWVSNPEDWNFPNHAIDTSCPSADGRTRLLDIHQGCSTGLTLRRTTHYDSCGSSYSGAAILVGGGQRADEYPKANLLAALKSAVKAGVLPEVKEVIDIDDLHWSQACRANWGARGCCNVANGFRQYSGHAGVQLTIPTSILQWAPVCKDDDDPLHKFECSDLSSRPALERLADVLRGVLSQSQRVADLIAAGAGVDEIIALEPLSEESLLAVVGSNLKNKDKVTVLLAASPGLTDPVLIMATQTLTNPNELADVLMSNSPGLSDDVLLAAVAAMKNPERLADVLLANCPISSQVLTAAARTLSTKQLKQLQACVPPR